MPFRRVFYLILGIFSLGLFLASIYLARLELNAYRAQRAVYPPGSEVGGIQAGGIDRDTALTRLQQAYLLPVELHYGEAVIHMDPREAGVTLDEDGMLAIPDEIESQEEFWKGFWDYLMGRTVPPVQTPFRADYQQELLQAYLENEIVPRYDQPATSAEPVPGTLGFEHGKAGTSLDVAASLPLIDRVIFSRTNRQVDLPIQTVPAGPPNWENLEIMLRQINSSSGFDGILDLLLIDLKTPRQIHFATRGSQELSTEPDIAFTASSIIKIPVMISVFRRLDEAPGPNTDAYLKAMFAKSSNEAADALMKYILDEIRGPLIVSEDLQVLGYQSTFLAGYFGLGSPLLQVFTTPANSRADVNTAPDKYNQTTPGEIGRLLADIYRCAEGGQSDLLTKFPGEITREECQLMIGYLKEDREPYLIKAGLPDGTPIGHKHGYGSAYDIIYTIGDAALVFTPGGDYVFVVFAHHPQLLLWDETNVLIARLSRAVYNFFNPEQ